MKINRKELLEAVKVASKLTSGHGNFPVLQCVLLGGPGQRLVATDLKIGLFAPLEITDYTRETEPETIPDDMLEGLKAQHLKEVAAQFDVELTGKATVAVMKESILNKFREEAQAGTIHEEAYCLPAASFGKILATLEEDVVEITLANTDEGNGMLFGDSQGPRVRIGNNFHDLATFPVDEFPVPRTEMDADSELAELTVTRKGLLDVAVAADKEKDTGFRLGVLHFDLSDRENPSVVATDGHRLHWTSLSKETVKAPESVTGFSMPLEAMKMVKALFPKDDDVITVGFDTSGKDIRIAYGKGGLLVVRTSETRFPDWKRVVPAESAKSVTIAKADMEKPLQQALTISGEKYRGFRVKFNGGIDVEFTNPEKGAYQKISIPVKKKSYADDEETLIGINGKFVLDAMGPIDSEDMVISFGDNSKPICMGHGNYHALVMPMRV